MSERSQHTDDQQGQPNQQTTPAGGQAGQPTAQATGQPAGRATGQPTGQPAGQPGGPEPGYAHDPGFTADRVVRWTVLRHVAAFNLLFLCLGLLVGVFPNLVELLGLGTMIPESVDTVDVVAMVGGLGQATVGIFALLLFLAGGPLFAAVLGVSTGSRGGTTKPRLTAAAAAGSFVGYAIPFTLLLLLVGTAVPTAPLDVGGVLVAGLLVGIPNGLAAAGTTYLTAP